MNHPVSFASFVVTLEFTQEVGKGAMDQNINLMGHTNSIYHKIWLRWKSASDGRSRLKESKWSCEMDYHHFKFLSFQIAPIPKE